jgi:hypothetical protein
MEFPDEVNLDQMKVYGASFGGPIAITKNLSELKRVGATTKPVIYIFSSSGKLISKINVSREPSLIV